MSGAGADTATGAAGDGPGARIPGCAWYALGLLTIVNVLNFVCRTLIYLLFTPIKAGMYLSDTQLAVLCAASFAIFFTLLGVPFGRIADRVSRRKLIAGGATVLEIVEDFRNDTYRAIYTVQFAGAVYVLHAFQKKSERGVETPGAEIKLIKARL